LENHFIQSEFIDQIFIHGDETREFLIAIIVISESYAQKLIKEKKVEELNDEVLSDFKIRMTIYEDILRIADLF
jgi:long-subunit acyl-CoA synthetase (AMP-forming)